MSEIPPPTVPPPTPPPGSGSYVPPPPTPPSAGGPAPGSDRTLMVVLSYLWILALIPLLTKKEDREIQWHAKNGLVLLGVEIIFWILTIIIGQFVPAVVGCGIATVECVIWIGFLVLRVVCIVKGVNGQRFRIPVVSDFADKM
ncbi:MAG TPA: DUF4870 domain-containing protein [Thermoanaerobaculia bacterium]|nr:DUF4870 domain-containing protein [Thermoanaerobaculia bacterium]